jgi:hypothetical protein
MLESLAAQHCSNSPKLVQWTLIAAEADDQTWPLGNHNASLGRNFECHPPRWADRSTLFAFSSSGVRWRKYRLMQ